MSLPSDVLVFIDIQNCPFRTDCEFIFKSDLDGGLTIRYITSGYPKSNTQQSIYPLHGIFAVATFSNKYAYSFTGYQFTYGIKTEEDKIGYYYEL